MKKTILFCLLGMMSLSNVWAQFDFSAPNSDNVTIYYNIIDEGNGVVEVTHNGNGTYSGDVVIPDSVSYEGKKYVVKSVGGRAFAYSTLTSLQLPEQLTRIKNGAFLMTDLSLVAIPENVTEVELAAFNNCPNLTSVMWGAKNCVVPGRVFLNTGISSMTFGDSVKHIPASLASGLDKLLTVTLPVGLKSIGKDAFLDCNSLKTMFYNGTLDDWYDIKFEDKESNPMCYASREFFNNQELIGELIISAGITEVKDYAFVGCTGLTSITIPNSLKSIGKGAFDGCESVEKIYSYAATPPVLLDNPFVGMSNVELYVPCSSEIAYLQSNWVVLEDIIGVEHWVTVLSNNEAMGTAVLVQPVECGSTMAKIEAIPNEGYHFVRWNDGNTDNPRIVNNITSDVTYIAEFAFNASGVDAVAQQDLTVVSTDKGLQVYGAAGHEVSVYNLQGLCLYRGIADEPTVISLPTGIYMVQAGGKTIKAVNK